MAHRALSCHHHGRLRPHVCSRGPGSPRGVVPGEWGWGAEGRGKCRKPPDGCGASPQADSHPVERACARHHGFRRTESPQPLGTLVPFPSTFLSEDGMLPVVLSAPGRTLLTNGGRPHRLSQAPRGTTVGSGVKTGELRLPQPPRCGSAGHHLGLWGGLLGPRGP